MTTRRIRAREAWVGYALLLPAMVAFGVFAFYPLVKVVQLGLYRVPPFPGLPSHYAGLSQYGSVLRSSSFLQALWNTVLFVLFTVPVGIAVGLALATLAHKELKGMRVFRTIFSSTVATSTAVAGLIFFTLLDPEVGLVSYWLGERGGSGLLGSPTFALPALSVATIWQGIGFTFIITSAALQSLPEDVLEAALVDGSAGWHRFRHVTFPLLSPTIFFLAVVSSIGAFQSFAQVDVLTSGGPVGHTTTLLYAIYTAAYLNNDPGTGAVMAVGLFVILLALALFQFRLLQRRVQYAA